MIKSLSHYAGYSYCQSSIDNHNHINKSIIYNQIEMVNVINCEWV